MARSRLLSFLNLTCRFGDRFVLLDLAPQVVIPAFFTNHVRRYGKTRYFFVDVGSTVLSLPEMDGEQVIIYGRFVKDTILTRSQIYEPGAGLVADADSMQSSPSSVFALDLNNHKLIFSHEVPYAPTVENFVSTIQSFIGRERDRYVRALHAESVRSPEPRTLSFFFEDVPPPTVEATPLATRGSVKDFIDTFDKVTSVSVTLLDVNAEFSKRDLFREMRRSKDETTADSTTLNLEKKSGLRKDAVVSELTAAAAGGNQKVLVRGVGSDGARLSGDNEQVKFQIEAPDLPDDVPSAATQMVRTLSEQTGKGRIILDEGSLNRAKLDAAREALRK